MGDNFQYPSDREEEWRTSVNGSDIDWFYLNSSTCTEPWIKDVFMGGMQDPTLSHNDTASGISNPEKFTRRSLEKDSSLYTSSGAQFNAPMNPTLNLSGDFSSIHDETWTTTSDLVGEFGHLSTISQYAEIRPESNEPWDPLGQLRVTEFDRGDVTFADSPKSSSDQSTHGTSREADDLPQEATTDMFSGAILQSSPLESLAVVNQQVLQWEPVIVVASGPPRNGVADSRDFNRRRRKGRRGPLESKKAQDARVMRKIGVCWPCRVSKIKCSPGSPCEACQYHQLSISPHVYQICCRSGLADFTVLFFPRVLISHFNKEEVKSLVARNVESFIDPSRIVRVHCGMSFPPMELVVHFFRHKTDTLQSLDHFTGFGKERASKMIKRRCAPVGILAVDVDDLGKQCTSCIESMVSSRTYAEQVTAGENTGIYRRTLESIHRYSRVEKNSLLDKAMKLYAMHYFMASMLIFTNDSVSLVKRVSRKRLGLDLPSDVISSRLLNRQVKHVMHILHRRQTNIVLEEFDRYLRKREQAGWPISFCVVLILCLCIEDIQIAAKNFVFTDSEISQGLRSESSKACWQLEDNPYRQYTQLFHDMYRSFKQPNSYTTERGFNPILEDLSHLTNWSQATKNLIQDMRQLINNYRAEMTALSISSDFDDQDQLLQEGLSNYHPVRLLSRFLLSFMHDS